MKKILIIDDNVELANAVAEVLSVHGLRTETAHGAQAGLQAVGEFTPDVVFLDLGMPEMNGYQVAAAIRADRYLSQPYLIAYTAWDDAATVRRALLAGFNLHIAKTSSLGELLEAVSQVH